MLCSRSHRFYGSIVMPKRQYSIGASKRQLRLFPLFGAQSGVTNVYPVIAGAEKTRLSGKSAAV
jgi:hypothetical protein